MTHEFLSMINAREYWSKQFNRCPCDFHHMKKKESQANVRRIKNHLKRKYIENTLDKYKNDSKKLWQNIRQFWPSNKDNSSDIKSIHNKTDT